MKHKRSLYISTKLQEKQIDIEIYVEEFNPLIPGGNKKVTHTESNLLPSGIKGLKIYIL